MNKTLEIKILKYLSEKDNTEFTDVSNLESNFELIQSTVKVLESRRFLEHKTYPNGIKNENGINVFPKILECKILLLGKEYLSKNETNWYNQPWIGFLIAFIALFFPFYQVYQNHTLKDDISYLEKRIDSLKGLILSQDKELDSLNIEVDSLEKKLYRLKYNIDKKK
jgi:hypothetical protein